MFNTPRGLDFFVSLHLTIFERPANFEFSNELGKRAGRCPAPRKGLAP
jgi:hypothetical protein